MRFGSQCIVVAIDAKRETERPGRRAGASTRTAGGGPRGGTPSTGRARSRRSARARSCSRAWTGTARATGYDLELTRAIVRGRVGARHRLGRSRRPSSTSTRPRAGQGRRRARRVDLPLRPSTPSRRPSGIFARGVCRSASRRRAVTRSPGRSAATREGLIPAVVQEATTGEVLMVAWMNAEALERDAAHPGDSHFWSRSRQALWQKGETSGHVQHVEASMPTATAIRSSSWCTRKGVACHTGSRTCFFTRLDRPAPPGMMRRRPAPGRDPRGRRARHPIAAGRAAARARTWRASSRRGTRDLARKIGEEAIEVDGRRARRGLGAARGRGRGPLVPHPRADGGARPLGAPRLRGAGPSPSADGRDAAPATTRSPRA